MVINSRGLDKAKLILARMIELKDSQKNFIILFETEEELVKF